MFTPEDFQHRLAFTGFELAFKHMEIEGKQRISLDKIIVSSINMKVFLQWDFLIYYFFFYKVSYLIF